MEKAQEKLLESILKNQNLSKALILILYANQYGVATKDLINYFKTSPSSFSNITKKLRDSKIIYFINKGKEHYYFLDEEVLQYLQKNHPELENISIEKFKEMPRSLEKEFNSDINPVLRKSYIKAIELLKMPRFMNLLINYSFKEALIIALIIICYLENTSYEIKEIASLLNITELEVIDTYSRVLTVLKSTLNNIGEDILNESNSMLRNK